MPNGRAPEIGEQFKLAGAANTLRRIAQSKGRDFYEGELAEKIAAFATECGAALTLDDLRNYQPEWVEPIYKDYHGYTLHERSEEHTSELQSLMRISYAVFCLKKKNTSTQIHIKRLVRGRRINHVYVRLLIQKD